MMEKVLSVEMHSKEKIYIPELISGHLLTSSNYSDSKNCSYWWEKWLCKINKYYFNRIFSETIDHFQ